MREPEELLEYLDPEQQLVARQVRGPLCVRAGAGTGKTRAIIYRIAYAIASGVYPPSQVMAVTFTSRAAAEMRERLHRLEVSGVSARTFHSSAMRQLRFFWPNAVGGAMPSVTPYKSSLITAAAGHLGLRLDSVSTRDVASEVEWAKVQMICPDDYETQVRRLSRPLPAGLDMAQVVDLLRTYESVKHERDCIDFEDVLLLLVGILDERDDILQQVRDQYRHFVVDEYQDVSPLQQALLDLWLGSRQDLCVVGDSAQTIYSFAGATPRYLQNFVQRYPSANIVELHRNYRSTPQIVSLANRVVSQLGRNSGAVRLRSQLEGGPTPHFEVYADDAAEAQGIVQKIRELINSGITPSKIAVLTRINSQLVAFENALSEAGIGYQLRGGTQFFDRDEIRHAMRLLQSHAKTGVHVPLENLVEDIVTSAGWSVQRPMGKAEQERWVGLNSILELARRRAEAGVDAVSFYFEMEQRAREQNIPRIDAVTLASLHSAKGLEWEAVFLAGLSEGLLPLHQAGTLAEIDEETRLLYVGVTRAKTRLYLSWARTRTGRTRQRQCSSLLESLWPSEAEENICVPVSFDMEGANQQTRELYTRLCQWRERIAQSLGQSAATVLTDVCLRQIAWEKPVSLAQLAQVKGMGSPGLANYSQDLLELVSRDFPAGKQSG